MGLIIRERAGQLTLSRESRNKPEEKSSLETHSTIAERETEAGQSHADEPTERMLFAESQLHFDHAVQKVLIIMRRLLNRSTFF